MRAKRQNRRFWRLAVNMLFFYLRHGDPIYNPNSLTELGKKQAEALAKRLATFGLDEIYSSTSTRAKMTAEPTCRLLGKSYTELDWCNEDYAWEEMTAMRSDGSRHWLFHDEENIMRIITPEVMALGERWYDAPAFAGCNYEKGVKRVDNKTDEFFASLGYVHDRKNKFFRVEKANDKRIALFAHQGFGMLFLSSLLDIPYPFFSTRFDTMCSGMTVIAFDEMNGICVPKVLELSNDSHIYKENLPFLYNKKYQF